MKTVELFAGIGGFRVAADSQGLDTIWSNDHCPKATKVYQDRFCDGSFHPGDFRALSIEVPPHDLLTGGFPCQPFSSAGKKKGVRDPRGTLFELIVDVVRRHEPRFFVLENVKRLLSMEKGLHFATILSSLSELDYQIEWRLLNAMHFGLPQNRQRIFIVGTRHDIADETGGLGSQPAIRLASSHDLASLGSEDVNRLCGTDEWSPVEEHGKKFPTWGLAVNGCFFGADLERFSACSPIVPVKSVLEPVVSDSFDFTETTLQWLHENTPVNRFVQGVQILSNQGGGARMGYTIFGADGVAPTLTSTTSRHYERYKIGERYRRLTNVEYARIQGFPDDHCSAVSVYDQYALFGNAVPPPLAAWVLDRLIEPQPKITLKKFDKQLEFFGNAEKRTAPKIPAIAAR